MSGFIASTLEVCATLSRILPPVWFWLIEIIIGISALACCRAGINSLYRSRLIADMPTSKLRSAAQGYIELEGYAKMMPGEPIYAPLSGKPCVWYRYTVDFFDNTNGREGQWVQIESGISDSIFHLVDQTGSCVVDPDGANVTPSVKLSWRGNTRRPMHSPKQTRFWSNLFSTERYRYTESRLHEYDPLYAIGYFTGLGCQEPMGISEEARDLLTLWKRDRGGLLQRFDANRDGDIDITEWDVARQVAETEVIATWRERQQQPEINLLKKPTDGRPYLLSSESQDQIIARGRHITLLWLLGFLVLSYFLVWLVRQRYGI